MPEFVSRYENQPRWGEEKLCSFCGNEYERGYWYFSRQVACEECIFEYIERELFIEKR